MNILATVDRMADMKIILSYYGLKMNKSGAIKCPFHTEKTASLKLYADNKRWHCFGCGADGGCIDFVKRMEGVDTNTAASRVNDICSLNLPMQGEKPTLKQLRHIKELTEQIERERLALEKEKEQYDEILTKMTAIDRIIMAAAPKSPEDEISTTYAEALKIQPFYDFLYEVGGTA